MNRSSSRCALVATLGALAALACAEPALHWRITLPGEPAFRSTGAPRFVVIADTQYSVPATDYDLNLAFQGFRVNAGPSLSTRVATSFYRHSAANQVLPLVLKSILRREGPGADNTNPALFGMFLGDMLEFACRDEAETMFGVLHSNPQLPLVIALGNHDAVFHGSYDTDSVSLDGEGDIDQFGLERWRRMCAPLGGIVTKPVFIDYVLGYYADVWKFDIKQQHGLNAESSLPGNKTFEGELRVAVNDRGQLVAAREHDPARPGGTWKLKYSVRVADGSPASAHRGSHLWQRLSWEPNHPVSTQPDPRRPVTLTVLDTTDYAAQKMTCGTTAFTQVGVKGALSADQVEWLAELDLPKAGEHFVLTHYLPFGKTYVGEREEDDCNTCAGANCRFANRVLPAWGNEARILYAHVHAPFRPEKITRFEKRPGRSASPADPEQAYSLFRIPSLIDNHSYAVMDEVFEERVLGSADYIQSQRPFSGGETTFQRLLEGASREVARVTCRQRFIETIELERNAECFLAHERGGGKNVRCPTLAKALDSRQDEVAAFCDRAGSGPKWPADPRCPDYPERETWRCNLLLSGERALEKVRQLGDHKLEDFARAQLAATNPKPKY